MSLILVVIDTLAQLHRALVIGRAGFGAAQLLFPLGEYSHWNRVMQAKGDGLYKAGLVEMWQVAP